MSVAGVGLLPYVWHYVVARLLYDELVRPGLHGGVTETALAVAVVVAIAGLVRRGRSRRGRRRRGRRHP